MTVYTTPGGLIWESAGGGAFTPSATGYDGTIAVSNTGKMVNGHGSPIQLIGSNFGGLDGQIVGGWPANAWGSLGGYGGPPFPTYSTWKANIVRLPLNVAAWLNIGMGVLKGASPTTPTWTTTTATATTTGGTTLTVAAATSGMTGMVLHDLTGGSVPAGTVVTYVNATTLTTNKTVTVNNGDTLNFIVAGDPNQIYKAQVLDAIAKARAINCYIIIEAHWAAPSFTLGGVTNYMGAFDQPAFLDYDTGYPFWTAGIGGGPTDCMTGSASSGIVAYLQANALNSNGNINDIIFEIFNEPYFDNITANYNTAFNGGGSSQTYAQVMLSGGYCSTYRNQYQNSTGRLGIGCPNAYCGASTQPNQAGDTFGFNYWWRVAGYQQVLTGIRALGATNVIQVNPVSFSSKHSMMSSVYPTDSLSPPQVSCGIHSYQHSGTNYPATGDTGDGTASWDTYVNQTINGTGGIGHAVPVLMTEWGNTNGTGAGVGAPQPDAYIQYVSGWLDGKTKGTVGSCDWWWDFTQAYGYAGTTSWADTIYGASTSFTGSISGSVLNVSAGSGLQVGMVIGSNSSLGGNPDRAYITSFSSGNGGTGTYNLSYNVGTVGSGTLYGAMVLPA